MVDRRRHGVLLVLALLLSACATSAPVPATPKVGDPAIPFTALDVDGKPVSLDAFKGLKHVVLVFYIGHT